MKKFKILFIICSLILGLAIQAYAGIDQHGDDVVIGNDLTIGNDATIGENLSVGDTATINNLVVLGTIAGDRIVTIENASISGAVSATGVAYTDWTQKPQNTDGAEFITLTVTPDNANNSVLLIVNWKGANYGNQFYVALYQDSGADPLDVGVGENTSENYADQVILVHWIPVIGTTSSITFKVRAGGNGGTVWANNSPDGGEDMGGAMISSITYVEVKAS